MKYDESIYADDLKPHAVRFKSSYIMTCMLPIDIYGQC